MNDRLLTLFTALAALLLTAFLLIPPPQPTEQISLPTSEDSGVNGLQGLYTWLENSDIPVFSLRKRYTDLQYIEELAPRGNLMIINMPSTKKVLRSEWFALAKWIKNGNTAIILGAAYFKPPWATTQSCFCDANELLGNLGWEIESINTADADQDPHENDDISITARIGSLHADLTDLNPVDSILSPQPMLPVLHSLETVYSKTTPALLAQSWQITAESGQLALRLFSLSGDNNRTAIWQIEAGQGQIFFTLVTDLFTNYALNKADNAGFFANLAAQNLAPAGKVIFADYHFGLSDLYDPEHFFNDSRLHQTLGFIAIFWLLYVLGYSNRLAPVRPTSINPSARDFVVAMAGFFARRLDKYTLAQELTFRMLQDIRQQQHLPDEHASWQWLQQHPLLQPQQLTLLQRAARRQHTQLEQLTNTITEIRSKIIL